MKMLVIKPSSLGDVVHSLPFLKAVKNTWPEAEIDWIISKNLKGLLEGHPLIHSLIVLDKDSWKHPGNIGSTFSEMRALRRRLKETHYDMVVDLQGLLRSGLIASCTTAGMKAGFADAREGSRYFYNKKVSVNGSLHAVDKNLEAAKAIGAAVGDAEFPLYVDSSAGKAAAKLLGDIREYVVLIPSARWESKKWPAERYASLIKRISLPCVIAGGKADTGIAGTIKKTAGEAGKRVLDLCGKTTLKELSALLAGARAVVTNDTGPMHIAAAAGVPVIAVFGPTDPLKTGPYGWRKHRDLRVVRAHVSCSPCRKKSCDDLVCMKRISVDAVYEELKEYI